MCAAGPSELHQAEAGNRFPLRNEKRLLRAIFSRGLREGRKNCGPEWEWDGRSCLFPANVCPFSEDGDGVAQGEAGNLSHPLFFVTAMNIPYVTVSDKLTAGEPGRGRWAWRARTRVAGRRGAGSAAVRIWALPSEGLPFRF